jgi:hypothetical protein
MLSVSINLNESICLQGCLVRTADGQLVEIPELTLSLRRIFTSSRRVQICVEAPQEVRIERRNIVGDIIPRPSTATPPAAGEVRM